MANFKIKKGVDLSLKGTVSGSDIAGERKPQTFAVVPDDYTGIIPRLDVKEGAEISAGDALFHDKDHPEIIVTSPVSGSVASVVRGERRKILSIVIKPDHAGKAKKFDVKGSGVKQLMLESGLWACMRQRPYDIVPSPDVKPRDIFVTAFDSAPLAPDLALLTAGLEKEVQAGVDALATLTDGAVYVGAKADQEIKLTGCKVNSFEGPHPAGNAGVQINHVKPVNKGETVWTLDVVTVARLGQLLATGTVPYGTVVAVAGESVAQPKYVRATMGCDIASLVGGATTGGDNIRVISGNPLTGVKVEADGYLRFPYRQVTVIPEIKNDAEFMGWASLSTKKFSLRHSFTHWLKPGKKAASFDAKINGGVRAIIMSDEYSKLFPMDIYPEFLIKAIIAFDIDKMEKLGIYEVAPEDFALCEFADTSKLEIQKIVREGLDKLRKEMS